jgi:hypothetical protein
MPYFIDGAPGKAAEAPGLAANVLAERVTEEPMDASRGPNVDALAVALLG